MFIFGFLTCFGGVFQFLEMMRLGKTIGIGISLCLLVSGVILVTISLQLQKGKADLILLGSMLAVAVMLGSILLAVAVQSKAHYGFLPFFAVMLRPTTNGLRAGHWLKNHPII